MSEQRVKVEVRKLPIGVWSWRVIDSLTEEVLRESGDNGLGLEMHASRKAAEDAGRRAFREWQSGEFEWQEVEP